MKKTHLLLLPGLMLALLLSACGNIGDGNRAEGIRFAKTDEDGVLQTQTTLTIYQCFVSTTVLVADFTNGLIGDFTSRATYSSSNPEFVQVSNLDITVPGNTENVYNRGALFPVAPGTSTITAEFAGLKASIVVTVEEPDSIAVTNEEITTSNGTKRGVEKMVPGSFQQLVATAVLGGESSNVSTAGNWTSTVVAGGAATDTNQAVVSSSSGVVTAKAPTTGLQRATVSFPPCSGLAYTAAGVAKTAPTAPAFDYSADYEVIAPTVAQMRILTEPGYPANNGSMISGTSQYLRALADFDGDAGNGLEDQDLTLRGASFEIGASTAGSTTDTFVYISLTQLLNAVATADAAAVPITAVVKAPDLSTTDVTDDVIRYASTPLTLGVTAGTLDSVSVTPASAAITHFDGDADVSTYSTQYSATGCFTVASSACAQTWPVGHDVAWSVSKGVGDATVTAVSNAATSAGTVFSIIEEPAQDETLTVTATAITSRVKPTVTDAVPSGTATLLICKNGVSTSTPGTCNP